MPGKNKNPLIGWHPPAELSAWVRAEAVRRGVTVSVILNEALEAYRRLLTEYQYAAEYPFDLPEGVHDGRDQWEQLRDDAVLGVLESILGVTAG